MEVAKADAETGQADQGREVTSGGLMRFTTAYQDMDRQAVDIGNDNGSDNGIGVFYRQASLVVML